jgi:hypothetical protein
MTSFITACTWTQECEWAIATKFSKLSRDLPVSPAISDELSSVSVESSISGLYNAGPPDAGAAAEVAVELGGTVAVTL